MHETAEDTRFSSDSSLTAELSLVACGPDRPRSVALGAGGDVVIGRHDSCQLSLASPKLSRFHARFQRRGACVTVEDLGSRHGTWLSGRRVERAELSPGVSVRLADVVITLASMAPPSRVEAATKDLLPEALYLSPEARKLRTLLQRVARSSVPVLLRGETGTGKELAAREVHLASGREGPLRVVNCAAIPPQLIEATLFGHERGAFTGADRARPSIFEEANGGTLLLDEVGELSLAAQAALLRAIETRRLTRVGSNREIEFDVRIVSATHRDLECMTARGEFRLDLLHRLCVVEVELSPLRERRSEIAPLARHFLSRQDGVQEIEPAALSRLEAYDWPGNIRQLRNVIARAGTLAEGPYIRVSDLPDALCKPTRPGQQERGTVSLVLLSGERRARDDASEIAQQGALRDSLRSVERSEVQRALAESGGNQRRAAALLGVSLRTFERRLHAFRKVST